MSSARPTDEELRTGVEVLEWVRSTAEDDKDISDEDRLILSSSALWSGSFLRGALGLSPATGGPAAAPEDAMRLHREVCSSERRHSHRRD
jgi:hypothetical protein